MPVFNLCLVTVAVTMASQRGGNESISAKESLVLAVKLDSLSTMVRIEE